IPTPRGRGRPTAVGVSCAALVAPGCLRARRWARETMAAAETSPLDAPPPPPPAPEVDARFLRLRDDVIGATRSQRYFDLILWPRLVELTDAAALVRPPGRRGPGQRGPSPRAPGAPVAEIRTR